MKIGSLDVDGPLDLIECIIAFDSRNWFANKRDRMIYAVVFGISDECKEAYRKVGYTDEMIDKYNTMHKMWNELKEGDKCDYESKAEGKEIQTKM